jgi:hypothetical protein
MDESFQIALPVLIGLAVLSVVAGAMRAKYPTAPVIATYALIGLWLGVLALAGIWVAACPGSDCESWQSYDSPRLLDLYMAFFWGGLFTVGLIGVVWLSATISTAVSRRMQREP